MFKRLVIVGLALGMVVALSEGRAAGDDLQWKEKQEAYFEQIELKPGDVIEKKDWQKVEGLLPPQIVDWLKKKKAIHVTLLYILFPPYCGYGWNGFSHNLWYCCLY